MKHSSLNSVRHTEKFVAASGWLRDERLFSMAAPMQLIVVQESPSWGGYLPDYASRARSAQTFCLVGVHYNPEPARQVDKLELSSGEKIDKSRVVLGLSMTDLAKILGVSRKSVYNYKEGAVSSMAKQPQDRLNLLFMAVAEFAEAHGNEFRVPARALNIKIDGEEPTIFEQLCEAETLEGFRLSLEHLMSIIRGLKPAAAARKASVLDASINGRGSYFGKE